MLMETATSSLIATRLSTLYLPHFQFPHLDNPSQMHKYPSYAPATAGITNISTSPSQSSDFSPTLSSPSSTAGLINPLSYWTITPQTSITRHQTGSSMSPTYISGHNEMDRLSESSSGSGIIASSQYNFPFYSNNLSISGPRGTNHPQNQSLQHIHQNQQQYPEHARLPFPRAPLQGMRHTSDSYGDRLPLSQIHSRSALALQPSNYSSYTSPQNTPLGSATAPRLSTTSSQNKYSNETISTQHFYSQPYNNHIISTIPINMMSSEQSSEEQIPLVSNIHIAPCAYQLSDSSYAMTQQNTQSDRPFKCDQCAQSFNRNHDLKRHKRIHLAVKPFPCMKCDKSFSRKDALKRHILVKSCGGANKKTKTLSRSSLSSPKNIINPSFSDDCTEMNKKW
ncbi:BgtA-20708 [Blumeria graminis f. sp. tritici]|uniref:BgtA-20708 n=2 Tax=Blumeria graminis f. sp. tritici TaxID=62690 RepID=A0A9X9QD11_BLUGR|nr:hypothetical protein BGT96224_A20708 [Blumeria graminis f. sp. tritici 96224]VDB88158.1 BgtA-20708 [Blumeria graminis f. sp. tritici]